MFLTQDQKYLLFILSQTACMKAGQACKLLRLLDGRKSGPYLEGALRQLRHMGKVMIPESGVISLPYRAVDPEMLEAIDIMLDMTEKKVLAASAEKPPFKLCFLTELEGGIGNFAVMPVPKGKEQVTEFLPADAARKTVIFMLPDISGKDLIRCPTPHYFAIADENGGRRYFRGR